MARAALKKAVFRLEVMEEVVREVLQWESCSLYGLTAPKWQQSTNSVLL